MGVLDEAVSELNHDQDVLLGQNAKTWVIKWCNTKIPCG